MYHRRTAPPERLRHEQETSTIFRILEKILTYFDVKINFSSLDFVLFLKLGYTLWVRPLLKMRAEDHP